MDTHVVDSIGRYSGFAFLYLCGCLFTAVLNAVFVADHRIMLPNIIYSLRKNAFINSKKWINVNYLAYFIHLFIYVMNGLVYAMILTIAILTSDGWKGSSLFFIGVVIFNVLNVYFMLYYNSWQPTICFPYYKTLVIVGLLAFIIAQLTGLPGTPTYRAHGALYVALSAIPLLLVYTHHFDDTRKVKSSVELSLFLEKQRSGYKSNMDNLYSLLKDPHVLIPRQNMSIWLADLLYNKLINLQKSVVGMPNPYSNLSLFFKNNFKVSLDFIVAWLISYIPLIIFCSVMNNSIDTNISAAAIVLVVLFLNDLCLFSLRLKWSHLCSILVSNRFIVVLAGSYYWLLGVFVITLISITLRVVEILDFYVFKSKLSINAISSILDSLTLRERESVEHQKAVANRLVNDGTLTRTPTPVADASYSAPSNIYISFVNSYISMPLVTLHCILIVALIVAATTPNNLLVPQFNSATETEWAGLLWLAWGTAMVIFCAYKVKKLPMNKDGSTSIVERLEAALESQQELKLVGSALANVSLDINVTFNNATGTSVPAADSNVVVSTAPIAAIASRTPSVPDHGNHYTLLTAYLKLFSWLMLVATAVMAACIQRLWVIIPTITIIPISVFIWMKFMVKWGKDDNSFDKCLPFISPCYNCAQSTWERPTLSSLMTNILSNPLFALVLLIVTCAICTRMNYWYCVLYLCLWIIAAALIHMAAMYWFSNVKLDYILLTIISASFIPTLIWALVAGLMRSSTIDKYGVIMLIMSATVFQLLVIILVIYRDYLQMKASSDVSNTSKAKSFLYGLIALAFVCAIICASIFSVIVSTPLGIGFICLIIAIALYFHLQLIEKSTTLSGMRAYGESIMARGGTCINSNCPIIKQAGDVVGDSLHRLLHLSNDKYTNYLIVTGLFVTLCGLYGAIADSNDAFWWSSLSWLSMGCVFLLLGLQVEMLQYFDNIDRVYDTYIFVPVYCYESNGNGKVSNISFRSCGLIIFFAMLAIWGIWVSVIALPPDVGVVIYTISTVATLLYIKFGCGKTTLCINQLLATGGFTDELLLDCGNLSVKAFSNTTALLDPANSANEASDPPAVYTAIAEYVLQKQAACDLLNKQLATQCVSYLSPIPMIGVISAWYNGVAFDEAANEASVNSIRDLHDNFIDDFTLLSEFYAYFRLTSLSAARLHYRQHVAGLLAFIQTNSSMAVREKDLLSMNEVDMLAVMSGYNQYLKSKEVESQISKKVEERIKEQQRRIEEERRRVLEAELTKRRQVEEEERKHREAEEEATRLIREQEEQRKRDEEAVKIAREQEEQRKRDEENKKKLEEEAIRLRQLTEEAARQRRRAEEAERLLKEIEQRKRDEEAARIAIEQEEERKRRQAEEAERKRRQAEEEERKHLKAEEEAERLAREKEEQRKRDEEATKIAREKEEQRKRDEEGKKKLEEETIRLRRLADEAEHQRRLAEEAAKITREKEDQRKRDEVVAKVAKEEQRKREEENKKKLEDEAKQRKLEKQRKKEAVDDDDDENAVVSTYGRPVQETVDTIIERVLKAGTKYVDTDFTGTNEVLGDSKYTGKAKKEMKRLTELNSNMLKDLSPVGLPQVGVSSQDIKQGALGDCYFLSAIATVASKPKLIENIFPAALPHKGVYTVKLYHEGGFKTVVVDDYFPVDKNESLMFAHPDEWETKKLANSAWVMILEKGYAKLNGNYANIGEGGYEDVAMGVLTGGIPDRINGIAKASDSQKTWETLKNLYNNGHLLGAGSHAGSDTTKSDLGIVQGHAYSILQVREVDEFKLMQLRNPWGHGEWGGKWSDKDTESWTSRMKSFLKFSNVDDGTFWMSYEDFCLQFANVYICKLYNDWHKVKVSGSWSTKADTAAGCMNNGEWYKNPQYLVSVSVDCVVTVNITQSLVETTGLLGGIKLGDFLYHGVYVIENDRIRERVAKNVRGSKIIATSNFTNSQVVTQEVALKANGFYVVVPCAFYKGKENSFIMRIFCKDSEVTCVKI